MTEQEAIEVLNNFDMQVSAKADGAYQSTIGKMACEVAAMALIEIQKYRAIGTVKDFKNCMDIINKAEQGELTKIIDEWLLYRKIGTVEECREARKKQMLKQPTLYGDCEDGKLVCPNCNEDLWDLKECGFDFCPYCSQAIKFGGI